MQKNTQCDNWGTDEAADAKNLVGPILIIGVSGFIGSRLFSSLARIRKDVYGCSPGANNCWRFNFKKSGCFRNISVTDFGKLNGFISEIRPKTIFNLSAYGGHADQTDADRIFGVNFLGVHNALKSSSKINYLAFVQAGSSSEYGLNCSAPKEGDALIPNSEYSVSKIASSHLIRLHGRFYGFPVINLRLYSIYGPGEDPGRLIPVLVSNCLKKRWPALVDKKISHDFVYVDDCTSAFVKAALCLYQKKGFGEAVNIATGIKTTMEDLANLSKKIFMVKKKPQFGTMANRNWDTKDWYGDPGLAKKLLNWHYRTKLEDGLKIMSSAQKI